MLWTTTPCRQGLFINYVVKLGERVVLPILESQGFEFPAQGRRNDFEFSGSYEPLEPPLTVALSKI